MTATIQPTIAGHDLYVVWGPADTVVCAGLSGISSYGTEECKRATRCVQGRYPVHSRCWTRVFSIPVKDASANGDESARGEDARVNASRP